MDQVLFLEKKIFYTKLYCGKRAHREETEVEGERVKRPVNTTKSTSLTTKPKLGGTKLM